uniref:Peptidase S8/S53 domain-containing protein n=1 Tax=Setaria viridis TaxID=4556 RepID=A0A4V6D362_SETVI|nr:hypothetical protein SEVIR_8G173100v2 [Setaria viridis]
MLVLLVLLLLLPLCADASSKLYVVYMGRSSTRIRPCKDEALKYIVYSYKHGFSGFAAMLTETQADELAGFPGVISVKPKTYRKVQTTRCWDFLDLDVANMAPNRPSSRSFDDDGYGPVPRRWRGVCQAGEAFNATCCNRKLIGARWYSAAAPAGTPALARARTRRRGTALGTARTRPPRPPAATVAAAAGWAWARRARVAVYKACVGGECGDAEVLAAVDDAVHDGVDVLSLSLGGSSGEEIPGTLHAVARGIPVVFAAGNYGPVPQTVQNAAPWVITVAAATIDRAFPAVISRQQREARGKKKHNCSEKALESVKITGKVVLCSAPTEAAASPPAHAVFGTILRVVAGRGRDLIFAQYTTNLLDLLDTCDGYMPCVLVNYEVARRISSYAGGARSPVPDIAAPGVSILAAKGDSYVFMSGTSMACPHVSAVVALLKSVHPDWSPAMIKSAIVTTGKHSL